MAPGACKENDMFGVPPFGAEDVLLAPQSHWVILTAALIVAAAVIVAAFIVRGGSGRG
jgi:hypothetical protein